MNQIILSNLFWEALTEWVSSAMGTDNCNFLSYKLISVQYIQY